MSNYHVQMKLRLVNVGLEGFAINRGMSCVEMNAHAVRPPAHEYSNVHILLYFLIRSDPWSRGKLRTCIHYHHRHTFHCIQYERRSWWGWWSNVEMRWQWSLQCGHGCFLEVSEIQIIQFCCLWVIMKVLPSWNNSPGLCVYLCVHCTVLLYTVGLILLSARRLPYSEYFTF